MVKKIKANKKLKLNKKNSKVSKSKRKHRKVNNKLLLALIILEILVLSFLMYSLFRLGLVSEIFGSKKIKADTLQIVYDGLSHEEIILVNNIIEDVNPIYLENQQKIIFKKKISKADCRDCAGYNVNSGESIIIEVRDNDNEEKLKFVLCHEFLHTYVSTFESSRYSDLEERIVYDLGLDVPCFLDSHEYSEWFDYYGADYEKTDINMLNLTHINTAGDVNGSN